MQTSHPSGSAIPGARLDQSQDSPKTLLRKGRHGPDHDSGQNIADVRVGVVDSCHHLGKDGEELNVCQSRNLQMLDISTYQSLRHPVDILFQLIMHLIENPLPLGHRVILKLTSEFISIHSYHRDGRLFLHIIPAFRI